jgi:hypothetical protein
MQVLQSIFGKKEKEKKRPKCHHISRKKNKSRGLATNAK